MSADRTRAPVPEALAEYRRSGRLSFTPPGHKQARGAAHADDRETAGELLSALKELARSAPELEGAPRVAVPEAAELRMEQAVLPRDAFFGPAEAVSLGAADGRIATEMITPYPPGIPAVLPGERLREPVLRYLRTGLAAGMNLPDAADPSLETIRVVARS
jgi:lysine decarboxylase